jgi:hypothetical protein
MWKHVRITCKPVAKPQNKVVIVDLIQPACTDIFQWWKIPLQLQTLFRCKVHNQDVPICVMLICWGSPVSSWRSTCSVEIDFQDPSCACKCNSATYKKTVLYTWSVAAILPRMIFHATCSMTIMTRCMHTLVEVAMINRASCNYHWVATPLQLWLVQYGVPQDSWTASC